MINKRITRAGAFALSVIMIFSIVLVAITALADTTALAGVTQAQINKLREEKKSLENQKREVQAKIDAIAFERLSELAKKEVLDQQIALTELEISNVEQIIDQFNMLIREQEYEVVIAQNREDAQLERYRTRVRDMEENGIVTYLEIIFDSTSFADLLARIDFVNDIMRADETSYIVLQQARAETIEAKTVLEDTKAELDDEKLYLEIKNEELNEQLEAAYELIRQLEEDIEAEEELRDQFAAEEDRVQKEINAAVAELQRQQEAARLAAQRRSGSSGGGSSGGGWVSGTGDLMWPTSGSISSNYGARGSGWHQGIDISAPRGTTVVAADSGTVVTSTNAGAYGNYIVISHGNGMTTLYAHLTTRAVGVGESVSKGQYIGTVGSTGRSTGPHLHFEVSVNGSRVNPLSRL